MLLLSDPAVLDVPVMECGETLVDLREVEDLALDRRKEDSDGAWARLRAGVVDPRRRPSLRTRAAPR